MLLAQQLGAEAVTYDNATSDQYLLDVQNGRTDFIPNDYYLQLMAIESFKDMDTKIGNVFYNPDTSSFVYSKEAKSLQEKVDEIIRAMKEEGLLTKYSKEYYMGHDVSEEKAEINGVKRTDLPVIKLK